MEMEIKYLTQLINYSGVKISLKQIEINVVIYTKNYY